MGIRRLSLRALVTCSQIQRTPYVLITDVHIVLYVCIYCAYAYIRVGNVLVHNSYLGECSSTTQHIVSEVE